MSLLIKKALTFGYLQWQNFQDSLNLKEFTLDSEVEKKALADLKELGIHVIPNYYPDELCDKISEQLKSGVKRYNDKIWKDSLGADNRIYGAEVLSDEIMAFNQDTFFHKLGEAYHRAEIQVNFTLGAELIAKTENLGSGGGWHRDSIFKTEFKSIVYLSDVTDKNGPFQYIPKTHLKHTLYKSIKQAKTLLQFRLTHKEVLDFLTQNKEYNLETYTAKKGTLILVDTLGIHRGMPIKEGERYALTNYFAPKHHMNKKQEERIENIRAKL